MSDPQILQIQRDLLTLGFDPGPLDGLLGKRTRAALLEYTQGVGLDAAAVLNDPSKFHAQAEAKREAADLVIHLEGDKTKLKPKVRDWSKPVYLQVHQTDFWAGDGVRSLERMKTNLYVSTQHVYEVHPVSCIVEDNYSDFVHVEVSWVSESRKTVTEGGRTYHREPGVWTDWRERLLDRALAYLVAQCRAHGQDPTIITHRQTYKDRAIDPDPEIAQATYRIAKSRGFKLDFDWVRGSGQSAALWYPAGCGKLG